MVTLAAPPLARAIASSRALTTAARRKRLDLRTPTSISYLRGLASAQRALQGRIVRAIPGADVRWHYGIVVDGIAVDLPSSQVSRLASIPGVTRVWPSIRYHALGGEGTSLDQSPDLIGAPELWGPSFTTAGNGIKIGIIDDGVDQRHPFFNPSGFGMPHGFPKGNKAYTTAKVIVARAFPPPSPRWRYARRPFDPLLSEHGTHVAGIAAGDHGVSAGGAVRVTGIAPNAYIGNYKVLSIPTVSGVGPDGNSPEIAKGIEAAVRDGMDVINLSLGEPEIEPSRDIVVKAIDGAAEAGVVPTIAAGNDFDSFGRGSVDSPANAPEAITAAAVSKSRVIASFSSGGPTPISLQMKPDVSAPGVNILSSVPESEGTWDQFSGTSMAAPHVAGAAALLRERHPGWTVEQIKSALVLTGTPVYTSSARTTEALPPREGGGLIDLPPADDPLVFAKPTGISFRFLHPGQSAVHQVQLSDAGGGAGTWTVAVVQRSAQGQISVTAPSSIDVPGVLAVRASASTSAPQADMSGFVVLTNSGIRRRIPFWFRVTDPQLAKHRHGVLRKTGTYHGNTLGQKALVDSYRYPEDAAGLPTELQGPEQVFRVRLARPAANFGVAVLSEGPGASIQPRVVAAQDENRLTGYPALPLVLNPYLAAFLHPERAVGAVLPAAGSYDIVFDSASRATAGRFTFRFWIGDTAPPRARLLTHTAVSDGALRVRVTDRGSGVDPGTLAAAVDGRETDVSYSARKHLATVQLGPVPGLRRGRHRLVLRVSDYQESRNMEDVGPILPNTRRLGATFRVR